MLSMPTHFFNCCFAYNRWKAIRRLIVGARSTTKTWSPLQERGRLALAQADPSFVVDDSTPLQTSQGDAKILALGPTS